MNRLHLLLVVCCWQQIAFAQTGWDVSAFHSLSHNQRSCFIHDLHLETLDSAAFMSLYRPMTAIAREKEDRRAGWLLRFYYFQQRGKLHLTADDNIRLLEELDKTAAEEGFEVEQVVARHYLAFEKYYAGQLSHEALYTVILKEYGQMEELGFEKFTDFDVPWLMYHNGRFMYELDDDDKALQFLAVAERFAKPDNHQWHIYILVLNNIQTIYQHRKDYAKGIEYAKRILSFAQSARHEDIEQRRFFQQWQGLASIDIASMLVGEGKLSEGEVYATKGYELTRIAGQVDTMTARNLEYNALKVLVSTQLELGKLDDAGRLLHRLDELYKTVGGLYDNYFNNIKYFECHARYEEMRGDLAAAMRYARLAKPLQDSLQRRNDARKLEQLKQRLDAEKYTERIQLIESEKELQTWLRNAAFAILALVLLLTYGWYHRQRHLRRQKEAELEAAQRELANLTQGFREKSDMLKNLHAELEKLNTGGERSQVLEQLTQSTILTDDDWLRFRTLFEKVHPGFLEEQHVQFPNLTQAELRYLVLEKLQLSTKEMANMLGVNDNTIRQTRLRLRRKTG